MNLLRIQDALKNASDDQLMQLMQSPDSTAPSYLVLTEIRRRKDMRAKQGEEPETTVAEDLSSPEQTYDEDGIRSLRTPGYEQEERAAEDRSGISAMREGGVVRMQGGGDVEEFGLQTGQEPLPSSPFFERLRRFRAETQRLREGNQPTSQLPRGGGEFGEERPVAGETRYTPTPSDGIPPIPNYTPEPMGGRQIYQTQAGPVAPPAAAGSPTAGPAAGPAAGGAAAGGGGAPRAGGGAGGIGDLRDYIRRLEDVFPNPAAGMAAELEKARTNPGERRREAQNLALIEAGLRMMGNKNPSFLGAVGEAATPTVQTYAQQLGEIRKDARQDIRDRFELAKTEVNRQWMMGQIGAAEYRTRMQEIGAAQRHASAEAGANARLQTQEANRVAAADREETRAIAASQRAAQQSLNQALGNDRLRAAIREEIASERPRGDRSPITNEEINRRIMGLGFMGLGQQQGGGANYNFDPNAPGAGLVPNR